MHGVDFSSAECPENSVERFEREKQEEDFSRDCILQQPENASLFFHQFRRTREEGSKGSGGSGGKGMLETGTMAKKRGQFSEDLPGQDEA